jgi:multidrug transporter EmrE-like cation transporter
MKKLIDRIKAEETRIGKLLVYYVPFVVGIVASVVEVLQALDSMPINVPFNIKEAIAICTITGLVLGKLTKKKDV